MVSTVIHTLQVKVVMVRNPPGVGLRIKSLTGLQSVLWSLTLVCVPNRSPIQKNGESCMCCCEDHLVDNLCNHCNCYLEFMVVLKTLFHCLNPLYSLLTHMHEAIFPYCTPIYTYTYTHTYIYTLVFFLFVWGYNHISITQKYCNPLIITVNSTVL